MRLCRFRFARWLGFPIVWFGAYVMVALICAAVYTGMPLDFVQTTITHEPAFQELRHTAERMIEEDVEAQMAGRTKAIPPTKRLDDVRIHHIVVAGSGDEITVSFQIVGSLYLSEPGLVGFDARHVVTRLQRNPVEFPALSPPPHANELPKIPVLNIVTTDRPIDRYDPLRYLLTAAFTTPAPAEHLGDAMVPVEGMMGDDLQIGIRPATWDAINAIGLALDSIPGRVPDRAWRMGYFSLVTIATLGYGDIVPVTTRARVWIAAEVTLGMLFFGLFIATLSTWVARVAAPQKQS